MARQKLGQHFLADLSWRKKILATLAISRGEKWVEIGPGHGEMTELLARAGARVTAIETDAQLAEGLQRKAAEWGDVEIIRGDVLETDFAKVAAAYGIASRRLETERLPNGPEQDRIVAHGLEWLWCDPGEPVLLEVGIPMAANVYPKLAFGRPITEMEPDAKPLDMEGT